MSVAHTGDDPIVSGELEDWTHEVDAACWVNRWDPSIRIPMVQVASLQRVSGGADDRHKTPEQRRDELNKMLNSMATAVHKNRKRGKK